MAAATVRKRGASAKERCGRQPMAVRPRWARWALMGFEGPSMVFFFLIFYSINRGGRTSTSENVSLIEASVQRQMQKPLQKCFLVVLGMYYF